MKLRADGRVETNKNDICESGQCIRNGIGCALQDFLKEHNVPIRMVIYSCDDRKVHGSIPMYELHHEDKE